MARLPKPTELKKLEGNRGKRRLNKQEPDPDYLQDLSPPDWLSAIAKAEWEKHVKALRKARLITEVDTPLFAMAMQSLGNYIEAQTHLNALRQDVGSTVLVHKSSEDKMPQPNPWLIIQSMSARQFAMIAKQFGMSPAARTAIQLNPQTTLPGFEVDNESSAATKKPESKYFN